MVLRSLIFVFKVIPLFFQMLVSAIVAFFAMPLLLLISVESSTMLVKTAPRFVNFYTFPTLPPSITIPFSFGVLWFFINFFLMLRNENEKFQ